MITKTAPAWREVDRFDSWDAADALRLATLRDTPSLEVRIRSHWGYSIVEVRGTPR